MNHNQSWRGMREDHIETLCWKRRQQKPDPLFRGAKWIFRIGLVAAIALFCVMIWVSQ